MILSEVKFQTSMNDTDREVRPSHNRAKVAFTFKSRDVQYLAGHATTRIHRFPGVPGEERAHETSWCKIRWGDAPERALLMPAAMNLSTHLDGWWGKLSLCYRHIPAPTGIEFETEQAVLAVLAAHPPVSFVGDTEGSTITLNQLNELIESAIKNAEREAKRQRASAAQERREIGWTKIEEALTAPDADQVITEGRWAGFRRGDAVAWSWNLFQGYRPKRVDRILI